MKNEFNLNVNILKLENDSTLCKLKIKLAEKMLEFMNNFCVNVSNDLFGHWALALALNLLQECKVMIFSSQWIFKVFFTNFPKCKNL
jgi:hypothetical protein